jgi:hypothetical protein
LKNGASGDRAGASAPSSEKSPEIGALISAVTPAGPEPCGVRIRSVFLSRLISFLDRFDVRRAALAPIAMGVISRQAHGFGNELHPVDDANAGPSVSSNPSIRDSTLVTRG